MCAPCRYAGILSAVGIHLADIVQEAQEPTATQLGPDSLPDLQARLQALAASAVGQLQAQGFDEAHIGVENFLNLRWVFVCVGGGVEEGGLEGGMGGGKVLSAELLPSIAGMHASSRPHALFSGDLEHIFVLLYPSCAVTGTWALMLQS